MKSVFLFAAAVMLIATGVFGAGGILPGAGTEVDPYLIEDLADFSEFSRDPEYWATLVYTKLVCDLDLSELTYQTAVIAPNSGLGSDWNGVPFSSIFDANDHTISNLNIDSKYVDNCYLGLFGKIEGSAAEVKNLSIVNCNITGRITSRYIGGLCGINDQGNITDCNSDGSVEGGVNVGGLTGESYDGRISNSHVTGSVAGKEVVGGLCAKSSGTIINCYTNCSVIGLYYESRYISGFSSLNGATIINCYAVGSVTGGIRSESLGGLCGYNSGTISNCYAAVSVTGGDYSKKIGGLCANNGGSISNCYATGTVTGGVKSRYIGGLCGSNDRTITNCYSTGLVTAKYGSDLLGGLCGCNSDDGLIANSFWDTNASGMSEGYVQDSFRPGTITNVTGKTTTQMQTKTTFTDDQVRWDFIDMISDGMHQFWQMPLGGGYPVLSWFNGHRPALSGDGTPDNPYLINNTTDLGAMWYHEKNAYYELRANIDLSGVQWSTSIMPVLSGSFDGNGYEISNLTIDTLGIRLDKIALIGMTDGDTCRLSNLRLVNCNISVEKNSRGVSGLCGRNISGKISNCFVTGSIREGREVGGLCGNNNRGTISKCYFGGSIEGYYDLGGLCGRNDHGEIIDSNSSGSLTGGDDSCSVGGLCGHNRYSTISNCYSTASVKGNNSLGGLCGQDQSGVINKCFATGEVVGNEYLGGLCGDDSGEITNCYAVGTVTGSSYIGGLCGQTSDRINNSYSTSSVNGDKMVGGLCGENRYGDIINCYSTGSVTGREGSSELGGLCGLNNAGTIKNCYSVGSITGGNGSFDLGGLCGMNTFSISNSFWDTVTTGLSTGFNMTYYNSDFITNVVGLNTVQMQTQSSFTDWDFDEVWYMLSDDYPRLRLVEPLVEVSTPWSVVLKKRVGRSKYEYECRVDVANISGADLYNVSLELVDGSGRLVISDPDVGLGDVLSGQVVTSTDTFKITIDRDNPAELDSLYWKISFATAKESPSEMQSLTVPVVFGVVDYDFDGSGVVDIGDLAVFASQWLQSGTCDVTGAGGEPDGVVNLLDLAAFAKEF